MWGHILIRTVWLGLFLLICLAALASFKLAFGSSRPVAAEGLGNPAKNQELTTVSTEAAPETLTKGDRLQVSYEPAPVFEPAPAIAPVPPKRPADVPLKIISRHWHDPHDQKAAQSTSGTTKPKNLKKNSRVVERKPTQEVDACRPHELDRVKRLFNLATDCATGN